MGLLEKFKERKSTNFYDLIPITSYKFEIDEDNKVIVKIPRFDNNIIGRLITKKSSTPEIIADLDVIGSQVWLLIDGEKSVFNIAKEYAKANNIAQDIANKQIVEYFQQLHHKGLIDFRKGYKK